MLELIGIKKTYLSKEGLSFLALKEINLQFDNTGLVMIVGKSGSGKSTLLNIIGGLDYFDAGEIIINGKSTKDYKASDWDNFRNANVGFVFQEFYLIENYTVSQNIALALELQGYDKAETKTLVVDILKQVELLDVLNRYPSELSGGQKQRIALLRALIKNPAIILADEPTGNLDSETSKVILELLKQLSKNKLVIMVTHDREFAYTYADRIIELKDGIVIDDIINTQSIIHEDKFVKLTKGKPLSEDVIAYLNKLNNESDLYLSIYEDNDEFNQLPIKTNIIHVNKNEVKHQALPFKHALKLAFISLFTKKLRLFLTTFLFIVSLTLVGVSTIFSFYYISKAANLTFKKADTNVILLKGCEGEIINSNCLSKTFTKDSELKNIKDKYPHIKFFKTLITYIKFNDLVNQPDEGFNNLYPYYGILDFQSVSIIDETIKLPLRYGEFTGKLNEVLITDHTAEVLIYQNVFQGVTEASQLIGKTFKNGLIISGIVKTNYGIYDSIRDIKNNYGNDEFIFQFFSDRQNRYFQLYLTIETLVSINYKNGFYEFSYQDKDRVIFALEKETAYYETKLIQSSQLPVNDNEVVLTTVALRRLLGLEELNKAYLQGYIGKDIEINYIYGEEKLSQTYKIVGLIDNELLQIYDRQSIMLMTDKKLDSLVSLRFLSSYDINAILSASNYYNTQFINDLEANNLLHNTEFSEHLYLVKRITEIGKNIILGVCIVLSLFTSFLIMTFISINIINNQKAIGTLRAIGASGFDVAKIFMTEGLIMALFSSIFAFIMTIITTKLINYSVASNFNTAIVLLYVDYKTIVFIGSLALIIVSISAFIPIKRLIMMKPINAIKGN